MNYVILFVGIITLINSFAFLILKGFIDSKTNNSKFSGLCLAMMGFNSFLAGMFITNFIARV